MIINQLTTSKKEIIPKNLTIINKGQQNTTRHRTKKTPLMITTLIPKTKAKVKTKKTTTTGNNYNNYK